MRVMGGHAADGTWGQHQVKAHPNITANFQLLAAVLLRASCELQLRVLHKEGGKDIFGRGRVAIGTEAGMNIGTGVALRLGRRAGMDDDKGHRCRLEMG